MKKIISYILLLVMCVSLFAGCTNNEQPEVTQPTQNMLSSAKDLLFAMYKDTNGKKTVADYKLVSVLAIGGKTFEVEWALEVTAGDAANVALEEGDKIVTVKILNNKPTEEVAYSVVGTIKDGDKTETVTFTHTIPAVEAKPETLTPTIEAAPVADKAFKFVVFQNNAEVMKTLYFTGAMDGYYLATTEDAAAAADVYLEAVEGGFKLYVKDGDKKTYIEIYDRGEGKAGVQMVEEAQTFYTFDETAKTLVTTIGENSFYLGCYNTYTTMSASNTSYISGDKAANVDVSQFPARICSMQGATAEPVIETAPVADKAFKFVVFQNNAEVMKTLYFTGAMDGYYLATTEDAAAAADVYLEAVEGGFKLYVKDGDKKTYIEIYDRGEGKAGVQMVEEAQTFYTFDATAKTLVTTIGENSFYLGCYNTYTTMSASNTSYISGDKAANVDVSQFPARICSMKVPSNDPVIAEAPAADVAYKYVVFQNNAELMKTLYFTGAMDGYYLATTEDAAAAADVYLEAVEGGFKLYVKDGDKKTYIEIYDRGEGKAGVQMVEEAQTFYTYDATAKTLVTTIGENSFYLGCYNTYTTMSASNTSYISGDKAANVDVSQFPARLCTVG